MAAFEQTKNIFQGDDNSNTFNLAPGSILSISGAHGSEEHSRLQERLAAVRAGRYRSFISYSSDEVALARNFHALLAKKAPKLGPIFFAEQSIAPGMNWFSELSAALESMKYLFVIFSPRSFAKHWLHVESGAALAYNKRLIPVLHGALSHKDLPFPYNLYQSTLRLDEGEERLADKLHALQSHE
jgi:hypothetical protein